VEELHETYLPTKGFNLTDGRQSIGTLTHLELEAQKAVVGAHKLKQAAVDLLNTPSRQLLFSSLTF
jgi:hypothetical protein